MKRTAAWAAVALLSISAAACSTKPKATQLTVTTSEYKFEVPATFAGGLVEITLDNSGGAESHEAELARLDEGKSLADFQAAMSEEGPPPSWAHAAGGPGPVDPGKTAVYTANLAAGTYTLVCHVPAPDGQAHLEKGMVAEVSVTAGEDGEVPSGDATIDTTEFKFTGQDQLKAGEQTVKVTNSGQQQHNVAIFTLAEGKTVQDILAFFGGEGPPGPPPFTGIPGLLASMDPGFEGTRTLELTAQTKYGFVCFAGDTDGTPHFAKGMVAEITPS